MSILNRNDLRVQTVQLGATICTNVNSLARVNVSSDAIIPLATITNATLTGVGSFARVNVSSDAIVRLATITNATLTGVGSFARVNVSSDVIVPVATVTNATISSVGSFANVNVSSSVTTRNLTVSNLFTGNSAYRGLSVIDSGDAYVTASATAIDSSAIVSIGARTSAASARQLIFTVDSVVDDTSFAIVPNGTVWNTVTLMWNVIR